MSPRWHRLLILTHRYGGIALGALFVIWFGSGIAMIYAGGMPALEAPARIAGLEPLALDDIRVTPADAVATAGFTPQRITLATLAGRPVYRLAAGRGRMVVYADTGEPSYAFDRAASRDVASRFTGIAPERLRFDGELAAPDQWTLTLAGALPLYRFVADDAAGTEIYVSRHAGDVVLVTTSGSRALAWIAAIPHWFYLTPLRSHQPLWYWTIVTTSLAGCLLAVLGLVLAVTQLRRPRPFSLAAAIPYRGLMRWHYLLGAVFGLVALTWVFSGLLSVEPFGWTRMDGVALGRDALNGRAAAREFSLPDAAALRRTLNGATLKELELISILDVPHYIVRYAEDAQPGTAHQTGERLLTAATLAPPQTALDPDRVHARLAAAVPDYRIEASRVLDDYDAYYYPRRGDAPLPVLRARFDDPGATRVYVDLERARILTTLNRRERIERWLYNGLHSLDFAFWYDRRPLWDIGVIVLCAGGLAASGIGLWLGIGRLRRGIARSAASAARLRQ